MNLPHIPVISESFVDGGTLAHAQEFAGFGCNGANLSPQLTWQPGPQGTQSYAVTLYDPDAPTGSGWWHWVVANIPADVTNLPEGGPLPAGATQARNDYGLAEFGGACPPQGDKPHRYQLTVWALKVPSLPITAETSGALAGFQIRANALASGTITGLYAR